MWVRFWFGFYGDRGKACLQHLFQLVRSGGMGVGDDAGLVFQHLQGVFTSNGEELFFHSGKVYPPMRELPSFQ